MSTFYKFQMDPIELLHLYQEGWVRSLDHLEPIHPYCIVHIHRICIAGTACFLIRIREEPTDIHNDADTYFSANDMFSTHSEFAINQLMIAYLVYDGMERVLVIRCQVPPRV